MNYSLENFISSRLLDFITSNPVKFWIKNPNMEAKIFKITVLYTLSYGSKSALFQKVFSRHLFSVQFDMNQKRKEFKQINDVSCNFCLG